MRRVVVEVIEVAFLSVDSAVGLGSPVKGFPPFRLLFFYSYSLYQGKPAKYQWGVGQRQSSQANAGASDGSTLESEASCSTKVPSSKSAGKKRRVEVSNE
jgi:hypothetical protein